jgi:mevalonate kinase
MNFAYSKILLFGEYSILTGSDALTIPFHKYKGGFGFPDARIPNRKEKWSNRELKKFLDYFLQNSLSSELDIDIVRLQDEINHGLCFYSSIPEKYGLGSSGALVCMIFRNYGKVDFTRIGLQTLKEKMAVAEAYFHGKSSGIDPLSIFIDKPLHIKPNRIKTIRHGLKEGIIKNFYLYDTGFPSETGRLVETFNSYLSSPDIRSIFPAYLAAVNQAIGSLLTNREETFLKNLKIISEFQLNRLEAMVPQNIRNHWKKGIESGQYFFKLCGSGGGGYMLVYLNNLNVSKDHVLQANMASLSSSNEAP